MNTQDKVTLEQWMRMAQETKKEFRYDKVCGTWCWVDREQVDNIDSYQGPHASFLDALKDAVEPYVTES